MSRSPLARLGPVAIAAALAITTCFAASPAQAGQAQLAPARAAAAPGTITGQLTTADGLAVGSAWVGVYAADSWDVVAGATTDADGRYTVDVPAADYKIQFYAGSTEQWAHQERTHEDADAIRVVAGETTTVDDQLLAAGTLTGRLLDATGEPVPYVSVIAEDVATELWTYLRTDETGRFAGELFPGTYVVRFAVEGAEQWAHQARSRDEAARITITAGQSAEVNDTLLPTGSLTGRLTTADGTPTEAVTVRLHAGGVSVASVSVDSDGTFAFPHVFAGEYKVSFLLDSGAEQWAHGKLTEDDAAAITVAAGRQTIVNEMLIKAGAIQGRFVDRRGQGIPGVWVDVGTQADSSPFGTTTDDDGYYRVSDVPPGSYLISFTDERTGRRQYAYGKETAAAADRISVPNTGGTVTVDDTLLAGAELRVTPQDASSGTPIRNFCTILTGAARAYRCTDGTELVFTDVPPGQYRATVFPQDEDTLHLQSSIAATAVLDQSVAVPVPVTLGGAIEAVVTDARTGASIADACAVARQPADGMIADGDDRRCSDAQGRLRTKALAPGTYNLFVFAPAGSGLGHQWVGSKGGTGSQPSARRISVRAGTVAGAPPVRLDPAGTITGTATLASTGQPVTGGSVSHTSWGLSGPSGEQLIEETGRYTITGLGPYEWPLYFVAHGAPSQWSGGTGNRFLARKVKVVAGGATTYSPALRPGAVLRGTVTLRGGAVDDGRLVAYNAVTGDPLGFADSGPDGSYRMSLVGAQTIKIRYLVSDQDRQLDGWYDGATDKAHAKRVAIPAAGAKTLDLKIP
ncbi:MAG TPA: carboxypeptidase regulatory-like domain-containing protein [Pilimelia sp.]|nr:carboxypeptidase regulatory-like domain-containing protein [Pilimelia sp.]